MYFNEMNNYGVVDISDDSDENPEKLADPIIEIEDKPLKIVGDVIILDEDGISNSQDINILDLNTNHNHGIRNIEDICKENQTLAEIIELCLDLENSRDMLFILDHIVLKAYKNTSEEFKKSKIFNKTILHLKRSLEVEPEQKFSHLKNFCNVLKYSKSHMKIPLKEINIIKKKRKKRKCKFSKSSSSKIQKVEVIIDLDKEQIEGNVINLEDEVMDAVDDPALQESESIKENVINSVVDNKLLVPQRVETINALENCTTTEEARIPDDNIEKIRYINSKISWCKENIKVLEQQEVNDDTSASPYILCEGYKAKIVDLYKQLCSLTGAEPIKRRKVRLKVAEGHPAGPVQVLQEFLNNNIDSTGAPLFPDFVDVVECVRKANNAEGLGWKETDILKEARALFEQCGKALQKRRQQREFRDLMSLVNDATAVDPADLDPELRARLQQNKIRSVIREKKIYQRYSKMQRRVSPLPLVSSQGSIESIESLLDTNTHKSACKEPKSLQLMPNDLEQCNRGSEIEKTSSKVVIKTEPTENVIDVLNELGDNYSIRIYNIEDPFLVVEISSDEEI